MNLKVQCARIGRTRKKIDRLRMLWIAHIEYGDSIAEAVTDIGVSAMHHNLYAVAPATLIAVTDEFDIPGNNGINDKCSRNSLATGFRSPYKLAATPHGRGTPDGSTR
jgi:hypothetical protein